MKGTILILAIVAMAGVGYGYDFSEEAKTTDGQTGVEEYLQVMSEANADLKSITNMSTGCASVHMRTWTDEEQSRVLAILERCLEELRKAHGPVERLQAELDGFNKAIRTAEKNNLDLSLLWIEEAKQISKQLKLRRDIKAALEALQ